MNINKLNLIWYRLLLCLIAVNFSSYFVKAQDVELVQYELGNINRVYDSSVYLSFNTTYSYDTDTVNNKSKHTSLKGDYTMYGHRCFYRIGNIEYLKNDSFSIAAYNDDKFLIASQIDQKQGASSVLPVKGIADSILQTFNEHYTTTLSMKDINGDTIRQISFTKNPGDSLAAYEYLHINYDSSSCLLHSIEYGLKQPVDLLEEDTIVVENLKNWNVQFRIRVSDYHITTVSSRSFSEALLINEEYPGKWIASGKYAGYTLYWSEAGKRTIIEP